jgi:tetratricopeptide (TPR) repeat protein
MNNDRRRLLERRYRDANDDGRNLTLAGEFSRALAAYAEAKVAAAELEDDEKQEHAELNVSMVLIQTGRAREGEEGLREILLRTQDDRTIFSAAYNLAAALRKQGRYQRAWRYSGRALEASRRLQAFDLEASCRNLRGNIRLNENYLDEAMAEYTRAVELHRSFDEPQRFSLAILEENIGYCLLMQKRWEEGCKRLQHALELAFTAEDRRCQAECYQDLCYASLLQDNYPKALEDGVRALELAVRHEYKDIVENCHYLLGELANRMDDHEERDRHFDAIQKDHPELPKLKQFLCTVDVTRLITLKR